MRWSRRLDTRLLATGLILAAVASCAPGRGAGYSIVVTVPDPDRSLLRQLALADPLGKPATVAAPASPFAAPPPFVAALETDSGRRAEDCLTAAVYYEARSEPLDGQRAVAQVVLNRVRDRAFPASVCGVVYQRTATVCQFTFACDGSTDHAIDPRSWMVARAVADAALGGSVYPAIGAATHYHTSAILPWWAPSLTRVGAIGSHVFYRWHDRLAGALSFRQAYTGREDAMTIAASGADAVRVVRGGDADGASGVTIHRGLAAIGVAGDAADDQGADDAGAAAPTPVGSFGVRVHRAGADQPGGGSEVHDAP